MRTPSRGARGAARGAPVQPRAAQRIRAGARRRCVARLLPFHFRRHVESSSYRRRPDIRNDDARGHGTRGLVTFRYGDFGFGVRVEEVAGMVEADRLAPLPRQCEGLAGLIAFRGDMVPVLHLASYLGLESPADPVRGYAIVLGRGTERFGLLVYELPRLVAADQLRPAAVSTEADAELDGLIESVFQAKDAPYHCLDYERILDSIVPPAVATGAARESRR